MNLPAQQPATSKVINLRLTGILALLWCFNLFQTLTFEGFGDFHWFGVFRSSWEYGEPSPLELVFGAPQYCLVVLPAVWIAMAGSPRPWRLLLVAVGGLIAVCAAVVVAVSWGESGDSENPVTAGPISLYLLTLVSAFVLLPLRLWGWSLEDVRDDGNLHPDPLPDLAADCVALCLSDHTGRKPQFSLTSLLFWAVAIAVVFSVLSTLLSVLFADRRMYMPVLLTMLTGCGVVALTPFVLRFALGERFSVWVSALLGLAVVLLGLVFAFVARSTQWTPQLERMIPRMASLITVTSIVWIGLQLLLVRAAGYRFLRVANRPIPIEPSPRPCVSARES